MSAITSAVLEIGVDDGRNRPRDIDFRPDAT